MSDTSHSNGHGEERRRAARYSLGLLVRLDEASGITRDVSPSGILFETDAPLTPGEPVSFTVMVDSAHPGAPLELECRGTIVRVEDLDGRVRVAAAIESFAWGGGEPASP